ncbi:Aste57867_11289 [Aphanomyces stellatus]|uniref:Aste57867_11289 protein n=1 Tax=Aphanomyces stellatus TaxID=120398 RepID=A0A485KSN7_9STRA|nr:hypothetical protein As57867_011247 [Aphanomyces stellatus]VFT88151.1 Aste57867_11289 [Aphanomyces stellatus]
MLLAKITKAVSYLLISNMTISNMTPTPPVAAASKQTIEESFRGASTRRAYGTYQKQFESFLNAHKGGIAPETASTVDCTDFFHHLYPSGKKTRTIDLAKSALDTTARRYIVGLQKFNKKNNVDEEKKAHPLKVHELSILMNRLSGLHPFVGSLLRLLLTIGFIGGFRISEVLNLRSNDVQVTNAATTQIYHIVDEATYPCLRVCAFYDEHLAALRASGVNVASTAFVFPKFVLKHSGVPRVDWHRALEQTTLRKLLGEIVEMTPNLPIGISLHSLRRGGAFYRVFESNERRFNFRELMAWCRWSDAKTCSEYLVTQSISNDIDPRNLLRTGSGLQRHQWQGVELPSEGDVNLPFSMEDLGKTVAKSLQGTLGTRVVQKATKQTTLKGYIAQKSLPTARSGQQAWQQWFVADPGAGLVCALKDYNSNMIRLDRKKYSERLTLVTAFTKYPTFEQFGAAHWMLLLQLGSSSADCKHETTSANEAVKASSLATLSFLFLAGFSRSKGIDRAARRRCRRLSVTPAALVTTILHQYTPSRFHP